MPNTSTDAPRRQPSRRTVLKTGAHAAWAVPAIQIAAAAPAFAATSDTAVLSVSSSTTAAAQTAGGVLTLPAVTIGSTVADAAAAKLHVSGSGSRAAGDVDFGAIRAGASASQSGIQVNLDPHGNGEVNLTALGTTANNGKAATQGTAATVYAKTVLSIKSASYTRTNFGTGSITVVLRAAYAPATGVKVRIQHYGSNNGGDTTSAGVSVPVDTDVTVTFSNLAFGGAARTVTISVADGTTDHAAGALFPADQNLSVPNTAGTGPAAALSFPAAARGADRTGDTVTMHFSIHSTLPVTNIAWTVKSSTGTRTYASGTATDITGAAGGDSIVPQFQFTRSRNDNTNDFTISATATTVGSGVAATVTPWSATNVN